MLNLMPIVSRFAPSPTGLLHLGHAYAALFAAKQAFGKNDRFLVRIEDIDQKRCQNIYEKKILEDLDWLGLKWEKPVRRQSEHFLDYSKMLQKLRELQLIYPCFCTRKQIQREIASANNAPHGMTQATYPRICRKLGKSEREDRINSGLSYALRLDLDKAKKMTGKLFWYDRKKGMQMARPEIFGDFIVARKEFSASYHLAATTDDHIQGISLVTRGDDLFEATHIHRLLQAILGLNTPCYEHHRLLVGPTGERFAKRHKANTLVDFREKGLTANDIHKMVGLRPN